MEKKDVFVDHYKVLGLPSEEDGAKLSEKEISKAYKLKALELHPDKRPDDPNAHENFQKLKSSYEILKDEKARKLFDDLLRVKLRVKREQKDRQDIKDSKRRRMVADLEERERAAFAPDPAAKAREDEEMIARKLKEEIARIRARHANKAAAASAAPKRDAPGMATENASKVDKEKILKVSWEKIGEEYSAERLRELFSKFGEVEDVFMRTSKKRRSAIVVMANKDAAVAATQTLSGSISNPLLVVPLQPAVATAFPNTHQSMEPERMDNLVGVGYKAYEDSVLEKLKQAAAAQNKK